MFSSFIRKTRQVSEDPILRRWLWRRVTGGVAGPPAFAVHRPSYLNGVASPDSQGPVPAEPAEAPVANISDARAREIALAAVPGEVMDVAVETKLGAKRIVVEIIASADMAETDVIIDMKTGEVLAIEK